MRRIITQQILDTFWPLHDAGETIANAATAAGISEAEGRDIAKFNRRYAVDCELERKAEAVAELHARMKKGLSLWSAARVVGLTYSEAMAERTALLERIKEKKEKRDSEELRPPSYITAEPYSTEWYRQQDDAFGRAMLAAHPELFKETV